MRERQGNNERGNTGRDFSATAAAAAQREPIRNRAGSGIAAGWVLGDLQRVHLDGLGAAVGVRGHFLQGEPCV